MFAERCPSYVEAYSWTAAIHAGPIGDPHSLCGAYRILQMIRDTVCIDKPPTAYEDILEPIAVVDAARIAQKTRERVLISDAMSGKAELGG